ncbi:hypothetical protein BKA81DRAFT_410900 [Phyllosticta paracitricarpa]|uniref:Uncharacterized protein n=1 Tax=Phyllosticta paracitricarpa TaxID=2016321 RepID=A0ABR1MSS0_9PEZI
MSANDAPPATAQSNALPSSDSTAATSIPTVAPIGTPLLSLWNELLLTLAEKVAEADTEDASTADQREAASSVPNSNLQDNLSLEEWRMSANQCSTSVRGHRPRRPEYGRGDGHVSMRSSGTPFSFALHQFWASSNSTECASIAQGIKDILQAPTNLQCLRLDGEMQLATFLEVEMEKAQFQFANLTEAIASLEMLFLLKYMPKITRLSNKTHVGNNGPRVYTPADKAAFYTHCRSLSRLKTSELTVADFEENAMFLVDIPDLSLETLAITRDASRCSDNRAVQDLQLVPINFLVKMALSQTGLMELQIPVSANIMVGSRVEHDEWEPNLDFGLVDVLPATIIAAKVSSIKKIVVGGTLIINVLKKKEGLTILELHHDPLQVSNGLRTTCWPDEPAAEITSEGKEGRQRLVNTLHIAIIAGDVPEIKRIVVGETSVIDVVREHHAATVLKLHHDPLRVADRLRTPCWHELWDGSKKPTSASQQCDPMAGERDSTTGFVFGKPEEPAVEIAEGEDGKTPLMHEGWADHELDLAWFERESDDDKQTCVFVDGRFPKTDDFW